MSLTVGIKGLSKTTDNILGENRRNVNALSVTVEMDIVSSEWRRW